MQDIFFFKEGDIFFFSVRRNFLTLYLALPCLFVVRSLVNYFDYEIFYYLHKLESDDCLVFFSKVVLVILLAGARILYVFRSIVTRLVFSSFELRRSGKIQDDLKFFGS